MNGREIRGLVMFPMASITDREKDVLSCYTDKRIPGVLECRKKFADTVRMLENDINERIMKEKGALYAKTDFYMMSLLVEQANKKHPGLNLQFISDFNGLEKAVATLLAMDVKSARLIVNTFDRDAKFDVHFAAFDCRKVGDKLSVVMLEPALNSMNGMLLGVNAIMIFKLDQFKDTCKFTTLQMDIQKSSTECAMFSLSFAKNAFLDATALDALHNDNASGKVDKILYGEKIHPYLPASFYKHCQSEESIKKYLDNNPEMKECVVNSKGERLIEKFTNNIIEVKNKPFSLSCWNKRLTEYRGLLHSKPDVRVLEIKERAI